MTEGQYYPPNQPPPGPPMQPVAPNSSKATTSLVLGICSLVVCGFFLGIPAMIIGRQAKQEIEASQGRLGGEGLATAGFITGLIGTIWSALAAILLVVLLVIGGIFANEVAQNCETVTDENGNPSLRCD